MVGLAGHVHQARRDLGGAVGRDRVDLLLFHEAEAEHHLPAGALVGHHLLLDEQSDQIAASIDVLAERVRKVGGTTIRSIGHIAKLQRVEDNDADYVPPLGMLRELMEDNKSHIANMREAHKLADDHEDVATASRP